MFELMAVALGAGVGAPARYATDYLIHQHWHAPRSWPWGTLAVNVVGALLLGLALPIAQQAPSPLMAGITGGFCGALTTYSTLSTDALGLLMQRRYWSAGAYVGLTAGLGTAAVLAGVALAS